MAVCGVNDFSVYGPEPTGVLFSSPFGSETFSQMCLGTIGICAIAFCWLTNWGVLNVMVTSEPLAVASVIATPPVLSASLSRTSL